MVCPWAIGRRATPLCAGLLLIACTSTPRAPKTPLVPSIETALEYFAGSALEGPRGTVASIDPQDRVLRATLRLRWFEAMPSGALEPVAMSTRLVLASRGDVPVLPFAGLLARSRIGQGDAARAFLAAAAASEIVEPTGATDRAGADPTMPRSRQVGEATAVFPPGITASFSVRGREGLLLQMTPKADGEAVVVTLVVENDGDAEAKQRQIIVLQPAVTSTSGPVVVLVEPPEATETDREAGSARAWCFVIEVDSVESSSVASELEACRASIEAVTAEIERTRVRPTSAALRAREVSSALEALADAKRRRAALRWLALSSDASLTLDLALTMSDAHLDGFSAAVRAVDSSDLEAAAVAWALDRAAWRWLVARAQEGELDDVAEAMLLRHAGEVGRYPSTLASFAKRSKSTDEMEQRVTEENLLLLEDGNPASRVRAFDWLRARDAAPEGFDPMAPAKARKDALARSADARDAGHQQR